MLSEELARLGQLHEQGLLDDEEFRAAKRRLLQENQSFTEAADDPKEEFEPDVFQPSKPDRTNGNAIAAFVLGIVGLGVGHVVALVLGIRGLRQINKSGERGRGFAIAGTTLGAIGTVALLSVASLFFISRELMRRDIHETLERVESAQFGFEQDNPGHVSLSLEDLAAYGFEPESGVDVQLSSGLEGKGYCAEATHET